MRDLGARLDLEVAEALAAAGAAEALLEPRAAASASRRGTKPSGSQPSAISAVSFTLASVPVPSQIGSRGFMCRIDVSGLPTPERAGAGVGQRDLAARRGRTGSLRSKTLRMIAT